MIRRAALPLLPATLLAAGSPAAALDPPLPVAEQNRRDAQCMMFTAAVIGLGLADAQEQAGLASLLTYYLGRIEGRTEKLDLTALALAASAELENDVDNSIAERCRAEMEAMVERLLALGDNLLTTDERLPTF